MIKKWLKACHVRQIILFNSTHVWNWICPVGVLLIFMPCFFQVPNDDEDEDEEGDTVFMPIKSNDDDEPVGQIIRRCFRRSRHLFARWTIITIHCCHLRSTATTLSGLNRVIPVAKVRWSEWLWTRQMFFRESLISIFCRGLNASSRQVIDDYSDPTETR